MANAKDTIAEDFHKIFVLGPGGAGKSTLLWTLPGKKFAYLFDPNALRSIQGLDIEYEEFLPDAGELDATMKAFNKNAKPSDKLKKAPEPTTYMRWVDDFNGKIQSGYFRKEGIEWLCIDSLTSFINIMYDRHLWINNRYGEVEEQADLKIVGGTLSNVFRSVLGEKMNIYCTGHINTYRDDKTGRLDVAINSPGRSRRQIPLLFTDIFEARAEVIDKKRKHFLLTCAEPRGFQEIRTSLRGIDPVVDVTIDDYTHPENFGIAALLRRAKARVPTPRVISPAAPPSAPAAASS